MKCPKCAVEMVVDERAGPDAIDRCPQCHGIWLDELELERLLAEPPRGLLENDALFEAHTGEAGKRLNCPRCRGTYLIKLNSLLSRGTVIDSCKVCHGTWLDAGELAKLAHQDVRRGVMALFRG